MKLLLWAAENGHLDIVKLLIKHGANVHVNGDWSLRDAIGNGHLEIAKHLIKHRIDISCLHQYAECGFVGRNCGYLKMTKFLVDYVPDDIRHLLFWAYDRKELDSVKYILNYCTYSDLIELENTIKNDDLKRVLGIMKNQRYCMSYVHQELLGMPAVFSEGKEVFPGGQEWLKLKNWVSKQN